MNPSAWHGRGQLTGLPGRRRAFAEKVETFPKPKRSAYRQRWHTRRWGSGETCEKGVASAWLMQHEIKNSPERSNEQLRQRVLAGVGPDGELLNPRLPGRSLAKWKRLPRSTLNELAILLLLQRLVGTLELLGDPGGGELGG